MASLNLFDGQKMISYPIPEGETTVGRQPGAGVQLLWNTVSGTHAKITKHGPTCVLDDLGSRNGTFVNGQRITRAMLNDGDQVGFGQVVVQFQGDAVPQAVPAMRPMYPPQQAPAVAPGFPPQPAMPFPGGPVPGPQTAFAQPPAFGQQPFPQQPFPQQSFAQQPFPAAPPMQRPPGAFPTPAAPPRPAPAAPASSAVTQTVSAPTPDFQVSDDDDSATITGAVASAGRFGVLDVNPEAKLKAVLQISTGLAGATDLNSLLPKILDTLFNIFPYADRGCVLLRGPDGKMIPRAYKHRREGEDATVRLSRTIVNKVLQDKAGILSADAATDSAFSASTSISELKIRSMMCVPLLGMDGEPAGIISVDSQNPLGQFKQDDLEILTAVAGQAALSYESARLMESFLAKKKQDGEMEIARGVQQGLLPPNMPQVPGYEFFASYDSAQAVGGDYYDFFNLGDGKICISFGDVAGKGVPGALIMARMSMAVQATLKFCQDVGQAIQAINEFMCHQAGEGRFVTYILAIINTNTHEMTIANAGHMSPIIRRQDGSIDQFSEETVGPPIGVVDGYPYDVETRPISLGDTVVIITDGVDEALNPAGELYTKERVIEFVKHASPRADELGRALLADVRRFASGRAQSDDITIMAFGRNA